MLIGTLNTQQESLSLLFRVPEIIASNKMPTEKDFTTNFNFPFGKEEKERFSVNFIPQNGKNGYQITIPRSSALLEYFPNTRALFQSNAEGDSICTIGKITQNQEKPKTNTSTSYRVGDRKRLSYTEETLESKRIEGTEPQSIKQEELVSILKNKKIVFYTGAGISRDIVPDMKTLEQQLHVGTSKEFVSEFDKNPDSILESWNSFASKCCSGKTTEAHSALARIARIKSAPIFTENVDFLQEYSGVRPKHINGPWLQENIKEEDLQKLDYVVTVGLSRDDRAFLAWYKEVNPNGTIIALDNGKKSPEYLGPKDFLLHGDCQQILPEIAKETHLTSGHIIARKKIEISSKVNNILDNKISNMPNDAQIKKVKILLKKLFEGDIIEKLGKDRKEAVRLIKNNHQESLRKFIKNVNVKLLVDKKELIGPESIEQLIQLSGLLGGIGESGSRIFDTQVAIIQGKKLELPELANANLENILSTLTDGITEKPSDSTEVIKEHTDLFRDKFASLDKGTEQIMETLKKNEHIEITKETFFTIANAIKIFKETYPKTDKIALGIERGDTCIFTTGAARKFNRVECDVSSKMAASVLQKLGGEVYMLQLPGHTLLISKDAKDKWWFFDAVNYIIEELPGLRMVKNDKEKRMGLVQIPHCIFGLPDIIPKNTILPFYTSIEDASNSMIRGNYDSNEHWASEDYATRHSEDKESLKIHRGAKFTQEFYNSNEQRAIIDKTSRIKELSQLKKMPFWLLQTGVLDNIK